MTPKAVLTSAVHMPELERSQTFWQSMTFKIITRFICDLAYIRERACRNFHNGPGAGVGEDLLSKKLHQRVAGRAISQVRLVHFFIIVSERAFFTAQSRRRRTPRAAPKQQKPVQFGVVEQKDKLPKRSSVGVQVGIFRVEHKHFAIFDRNNFVNGRPNIAQHTGIRGVKRRQIFIGKAQCLQKHEAVTDSANIFN